MPVIDSYSFGKAVIDGCEYTSDIIVFPHKVESSWWRIDGHRLVAEDLTEVLRDPPQTLVIGTGMAGLMRVSEETISTLREQGVQVLVSLTTQAVSNYNASQAVRETVAALHLTC